MTPEAVSNEITGAFVSAFALAGPILGIAAALGLLMAFIQAVTQIQDQTLPQIVKIGAVSLALVAAGAGLAQPLYERSVRLFAGFPAMVR